MLKELLIKSMKQAMADKGITAVELAMAVGRKPYYENPISARTAISKWLNGKATPAMDTLDEMFRVLGVEYGQLFGSDAQVDRLNLEMNPFAHMGPARLEEAKRRGKVIYSATRPSWKVLMRASEGGRPIIAATQEKSDMLIFVQVKADHAVAYFKDAHAGGWLSRYMVEKRGGPLKAKRKGGHDGKAAAGN